MAFFDKIWKIINNNNLVTLKFHHFAKKLSKLVGVFQKRQENQRPFYDFDSNFVFQKIVSPAVSYFCYTYAQLTDLI